MITNSKDDIFVWRSSYSWEELGCYARNGNVVPTEPSSRQKLKIILEYTL
jgi:hypothetical protein